MLPSPSTAFRHLPASQRILAESGYTSQATEAAPGVDSLFYGRPRRPFAHMVRHFEELEESLFQRRARMRSFLEKTATPQTPVGERRHGLEDPDHGCDAVTTAEAPVERLPQLVAIINTDIPWSFSPALRCDITSSGCLNVQLGDLMPPLLAYQLPPVSVDYSVGRAYTELEASKSEDATFVRIMVYSHSHG